MFVRKKPMDQIWLQADIDRERLEAAGLGGHDDAVALATTGFVAKPRFRFLQITRNDDRVTVRDLV
jgi:hypothetical protein